MTAEAVKTKSRRLELGHTLSEFMTNLGLNPDNGSIQDDRRCSLPSSLPA
jgi:hypothetical protein